MSDKKTSWDYQRDNYKQINIKFNMSNEDDKILYYYLTCKNWNISGLIKELVRDKMWGDAYEE